MYVTKLDTSSPTSSQNRQSRVNLKPTQGLRWVTGNRYEYTCFLLEDPLKQNSLSFHVRWTMCGCLWSQLYQERCIQPLASSKILRLTITKATFRTSSKPP